MFLEITSPNGAATQVDERAKPLVAVDGDSPTLLANTKTKIRFVPFSRTEGLIERSDLFDASPTDDPRAHDDVDLCESDPVQAKAGTDGADLVPGVVEVFPFRDWIQRWKTLQAARQR